MDQPENLNFIIFDTISLRVNYATYILHNFISMLKILQANPSYQFGFDVKDDEFTNYQNRKESREGGVIKGSYSVVDSDGFIRTVTYTADPKEGKK